MKAKNFFAITTLSIILLVETNSGRACSCLPPSPPAQAFAEADAVFMGKIISFELIPDMRRRVAKINVLKIWKGKKSAAEMVFTGLNDADCGYNFQVDETYVIYAYEVDNDKLLTHICTRTAPIHRAAEDLEFLDSFSCLPLAIGNSWKFGNGNLHYEENILDTLRLNGRLYYRFNRFGHKFESVWLRMTDEQELVVRTDTTEQVWLNFAAEVGEKWTVHGQDRETQWTVHLQSKNDTISVSAGTFSQCHRFYFQFNGADNDWVEWYTPNVGPVKRDLHGIAFIEYPLTSAVVNGKNLPTNVSGKPAGESIRTFELAQNYPNPFSLAKRIGANTATVIHYRLTKEARVILTIHDLLGREIKTLVQHFESPGKHSAVWDGTNSHGKKVPAGIYLYRIQAGELAEARKLILMR
jgi:hypothetical protein